MKNQYTAWAIRLKDWSLVPAVFGAGPMLLRTKSKAKNEIRGRASVKLEPGMPVKVTFVVREVAR